MALVKEQSWCSASCIVSCKGDGSFL